MQVIALKVKFSIFLPHVQNHVVKTLAAFGHSFQHH